ncbi:MAG: uracil-xanthine permease family protein [Thermoplasmata archaeon]
MGEVPVAAPVEEKRIIYTIDDKPPLQESIFLGIQHYLTMFGATVSIPLLLAFAMEMPPTDTSLLISAIFFVSGIATLLQTTIGNRLPVVQGGSFSFLPPTFVIIGATVGEGMGFEIAIQQITGAIMVASAFEIILGYTGIMGKIRRFIGPVTIGPTIALIGLALFGVGAPFAGQHWGVALVVIIAIILYSQIFSRRSKIFMLFPILLAILTGWVVAAALSGAGVFVSGDAAYVDPGKIEAAPWIVAPIPFRWGLPQFIPAFILGMLAAYLASMIESIGDYYAVSRISEAPIPTEATISRGLGTEGVGCLIASIFQSCNGSTTYSENIGAIGLTRVASRYVVQIGAISMIVFSIFGKVGGFFSTMPVPIIGAMYMALFGLIAAVGLSNLMLCDMGSPRNLFIVGFIFFAGLSVPAYFAETPAVFDPQWVADIVTTIGSTGMAVAAILGIILDNLIPGTREERGLVAWDKAAQGGS